MNFINIYQNSSLPQTTESGNYYHIADLHIFLGGTPPSITKSTTKTLPTFKNYSRKITVFSVHKKLRKKVPRLRSIKITNLCLHFVSEKIHRATRELAGCEHVGLTDMCFYVSALTTRSKPMIFTTS